MPSLQTGPEMQVVRGVSKNRRRLLLASALLTGASAFRSGAVRSAFPSSGRILKVGPGREIATVAGASRLALPGDLVEIDAGVYSRDVAIWSRDGVTVRASGGRVRMDAEGAIAEDKAIWVVRADDVTIEGIDFSGAHASDGVGAGIRFERGRLTVRDCAFFGNEIGLLTANRHDMELTVDRCEFARNRSEHGYSHQLYVGRIARLSVTASYFHAGYHGHLLKSRARESQILYNRLTDEEGGRASYELEFPDGGVAFVVGNLIEQSATGENPTLVSFGAERFFWPSNELYISHNTMINDRLAGGQWIVARSGSQAGKIVNNVLIGSGSLDVPGELEQVGNVAIAGVGFLNRGRVDYRPGTNLPIHARAVSAGMARGIDLVPAFEYVHPRSLRALSGSERSPGAFHMNAE